MPFSTIVIEAMARHTWTPSSHIPTDITAWKPQTSLGDCEFCLTLFPGDINNQATGTWKLISMLTTPPRFLLSRKIIKIYYLSNKCIRYISEIGKNKLIDHESESESEVAQSCPTLCDPMDYSLPGSSIHGIFHASVLEWVAISFSRREESHRSWLRLNS